MRDRHERMKGPRGTKGPVEQYPSLLDLPFESEFQKILAGKEYLEDPWRDGEVVAWHLYN